MRESSTTQTLLRICELQSEMLDTLLTESYITPEMLLSYKENFNKCQRAYKHIKNKEEQFNG